VTRRSLLQAAFGLPGKIGLCFRAMRSLALIVGLVLAATAVTAIAATTYRWVDRNGVVHYSDRPQPGAVVVETRPAQTFEAQPGSGGSSANPGTQTASTSNQQAPAAAYESIEIFRPAADETIQNSSEVSVRLRLEPVLNPRHSIWLYLDGKRVDGLSTTGSEFTITNVTRGTHSLTAVVADGEGKEIIRSPAVTFHVRQTSVLTRPRT
jgi:hypothetical protein